jgi:RNA recognition motif-containing protein
MMEKYGNVRDVYIPTDYHTRQPRGFAFVEFTDSRDARLVTYSLLCHYAIIMF